MYNRCIIPDIIRDDRGWEVGADRQGMINCEPNNNTNNDVTLFRSTKFKFAFSKFHKKLKRKMYKIVKIVTNKYRPDMQTLLSLFVTSHKENLQNIPGRFRQKKRKGNKPEKINNVQEEDDISHTSSRGYNVTHESESLKGNNAFTVLMSNQQNKSTIVTKLKYRPSHSPKPLNINSQQLLVRNKWGVINLKRPKRADSKSINIKTSMCKNINSGGKLNRIKPVKVTTVPQAKDLNS